MHGEGESDPSDPAEPIDASPDERCLAKIYLENLFQTGSLGYNVQICT